MKILKQNNFGFTFDGVVECISVCGRRAFTVAMNCFFFLQFLLLLNRIAVDGVAFIYSVFLRRSRQRLNNSPFEMSVMRTGSKAKLVHLPFTTRGNGIVEPQPNTCATHFAPKKTTDTQVTFIDFSVFAANLSNNAAVVDVHFFFRSLEFSIKKITIPFFLSFHCVLSCRDWQKAANLRLSFISAGNVSHRTIYFRFMSDIVEKQQLRNSVIESDFYFSRSPTVLCAKKQKTHDSHDRR